MANIPKYTYTPMRPLSRMKNGKANSSPRLQVLAAQTLKIASINGLGDTEKLETELEDEIRWEERKTPPSEVIERLRRRCGAILHTKPVLLFIVALNIVDCMLVMGQLTLDFHHVTNQIVVKNEHIETFLQKMKLRYTPSFNDVPDAEGVYLSVIFNRILHGFIFWNSTSYSAPVVKRQCEDVFSTYSNSSASASGSTGYNQSLLTLIAASSQPVAGMAPVDYTNDAEKASHVLHYCSLSILSVLTVETLIKIACVGKRFLKKRMEIFDAVVVFVSFILDIIFVEGLTSLRLENFVIIMSFLLPWRILRVLNSLIVAVMDQHRFHLKLLYKQKRRITKQHQEVSDQASSLTKQIDALKSLCQAKGVPDWELNKAIGQSMAASSHGGLKALSKLVFQAAESFAPISTTSGPVQPCMSATSPSSPKVQFSTVRCNGDVERAVGANGHAYVVGKDDEVLVENEARSPGSEELERDGGGVCNQAGEAQPDQSETGGEGGDVEGGDAGGVGDEGERGGGERKGGDSGEEEKEGNVDSPSNPRLRFYLPTESSVDTEDETASASTRL